jgi:hypothetical protein
MTRYIAEYYEPKEGVWYTVPINTFMDVEGSRKEVTEAMNFYTNYRGYTTFRIKEIDTTKRELTTEAKVTLSILSVLAILITVVVNIW